MTDKIKVLLLAANPVNTGTLRLGEETREIVEKIEDGSHRETFEVIMRFALRPRDLQPVLLKHEPHIVHFSGHGSLVGELVLEDDAGQAQQVNKDAITELFKILTDNVRIVVFNACFTKDQARALSDFIDFTVGTNEAVGDKASIAFAAAFYRGLAFGRSVGEAFKLGKSELKLLGISGEEKTEFFVREGADPDEPFLPLKNRKNPVRATSPEKLESALEHVLAGTAREDEKHLIRRQLIEGRIMLEQLEGAPESDVEILKAINTIDSSQTVHVEVGPVVYQRVQEQLYPPPPGIAPPLPGLIFIGREDSLTDIKRLLGVAGTGAAPNYLTVVRGWPGVGKTTLVGVLGRDPEVSKTFPDGVLWTALDQSPELISKLAEWGRVLGTDELLKTPIIDEAVVKLAALIRNRRMLLIVDDIWNPAHAVPFLKASAGSKCALLATTRLTSVAQELTSDEKGIYVLPVLTEDSALILLSHLAPGIVEQHPQECRELVIDLECLPLALHVAGRLLKTEAGLGLSVIDLISGIREGARLLPEPSPLDRAEGATIPTVAALLQRSTDNLDEQTRDCFAFLGAFAPKPATFDLAAMQAVWEMGDPRPIVRKLVGHGLLEPVGAGRFQMHALLVQHARSLLT
jgi:hypothetical protein